MKKNLRSNNVERENLFFFIWNKNKKKQYLHNIFFSYKPLSQSFPAYDKNISHFLLSCYKFALKTTTMDLKALINERESIKGKITRINNQLESEFIYL